MHILLLEDHPGIRTALQMLLELEGYSVVSVDSGESALDVLRANRFDVILLDLNTNGMSASEFVAGMDQVVGEQRPVLGVLSASSSLEFESRRLNADFSMQKPFDNDDLIAKLKSVAFARTSETSPKSLSI